MSESVIVEVDQAVATITLNRPEARNALTTEAKVRLHQALRQCADDQAIRAVILTGAGQAFCAGQDLREHADQLEAGGTPTDTVREHYNPMVRLLTAMPKPVIAALPGVAAGAGAALALACDFRIAARRASLLMAFARVGLGPDSGVSWTLTRLAGPAVAAELLMLAEPVPAERALTLGLLTKVVDDDALSEQARELADRLAAGPTAAYGAIKESLIYSAGHDLGDALEKEAELQARMGATDDHRLATAAFLNKRQPRYLGH